MGFCWDEGEGEGRHIKKKNFFVCTNYSILI